MGLRIQSGNPSIFNTIINTTTTGFYITGGNPKIYNNSINGSTTGFSVTGGSPTIYNNTINGSTTGFSITGGSPIIYNNTINSSTTGFSITGGSPNISNNTINNTSTLAVSISGTASPDISYNTINGPVPTGIQSTSSGALNIYNNIINDSSNAVTISAGAGDIHYNTITNSANGITISAAAAPNVYFNTLDNSTTTAISTTGSGSLKIFDNSINDSVTGISIGGSGTPDVYNNNVSNGTTGIEISSSTASIHHNEIYYCDTGAYLKAASAFRFYNNTLDSNQISFLSERSATIDNCTIINSQNKNFKLVSPSDHVITTINTSFNDSASLIQIDPGCKLYKQWYVHIYVNDTFADHIPKASVTIVSCGDGCVLSLQTDTTGWLRWLRFTEREINSSANKNITPHDISATKSGYNTTAFKPNITESMTLIFTLKDAQTPDSDMQSMPVYWYNTPGIDLNYSTQDNTELNTISLYYEYSIDNTTFGAPVNTNSSAVSGKLDQGGFNFKFLNGEGYYRFYTIATDLTGNDEVSPFNPDARAGYDVRPPELGSLNTEDLDEDSTGACRVNININDTLSGLGTLPTIRYKYDSTNTSWYKTGKDMTALGGDVYYYDIPAPTGGWELFENKTLAWQVTAEDQAGNVNISAVGSDNIDYVNHAPEIEIVQLVSGHWYSGTIEIRTIPTDNLDINDPVSEWGIKYVYANYSIDSTNGMNGAWHNWTGSEVISEPYNMNWNSRLIVGTHTKVWLRVRAVDNGNMVSDWATIKIKIDNEPALTTADYDIQWHNSNFTIDLSADDGNGSGVNVIIYKINDGQPQSVADFGMPEITTEGNNNKLEYWSIDNRSWVETHKTITGLKLDRSEPVITDLEIIDITQSTPAGSNATEVVLRANVTDRLSGLKNLPEYRMKLGEAVYGSWSTMVFVIGDMYNSVLTLPGTMAWDDHSGKNISLEIKGVDNANNEAISTITEFVDETSPPKITAEQINTGYVGEAIPLVVTVTDDEGVEEVQVFYKEVNSVSFQTYTMLRQGTSDNFTRELPAPTEPGTAYYYFSARDKSFTVTLPKLDPASNSFTIKIVYRDADDDDLPDHWEKQYFGGIENWSYDDDPDSDMLDNLPEYLNGTDPTMADTDGDGMEDGWEVKYNLSPLDATGDNGPNGDPDKDGHDNLDEFEHDTDPLDENDFYERSDAKKPTDYTALYGGLATLVVIIIILLLSYMFLRGRGELGSDVPKEDKTKPHEEPAEQVKLIKPPVRTVVPKGKMEIVKLEKGLKCTVCQTNMNKGEHAIKCSCGLILHDTCIGEENKCPQCGKVIDVDKGKIIITKKEVKAISKPVIHREVKRDIEELVPPVKAYFAYVPTISKETGIHEFLNGYFKVPPKMGTTKLNKNMKHVDLFLTKGAAKKMMDHCYKHGRKKEVMGLLLGETYKYENKLFSMVKDVATSDLDATEVNVRFDSFDKLFEQLDQLSYDYQIIGWYHSHPDYSSFMSKTDVDTQKRMFKLAYQRAIVIDPIRFDMKAFALDQRTKNKVEERGYAIVDFKE